MNEKSLRSFGQTINLLMVGENLTRKTAGEMFCEILAGNQPDIHQGAALAALRMKGETAEEIAGCFEAIYELDTNKGSIDGLQVVENCGTGMDSLKTFNISTISSIVAANLGVYLTRHGDRAITSGCGTVDLCEALGVDVECDVNVVCQSIETCGIGLFNGMSPHIHPGVSVGYYLRSDLLLLLILLLRWPIRSCLASAFGVWGRLSRSNRHWT
jgi:anthranilate phosphoribosyltransferase